jgi:hypothetical protein
MLSAEWSLLKWVVMKAVLSAAETSAKRNHTIISKYVEITKQGEWGGVEISGVRSNGKKRRRIRKKEERKKERKKDR